MADSKYDVIDIESQERRSIALKDLGDGTFAPASSSDPAKHAAVITPNDSADLAATTRGIYVGSSGDLAVITVSGDTVTFPNVPGGAIFPICVTRVLATGTTANNLVALR